MTGSAAELDDARVRREVVSFVRRSNRMRSNQRRAWETYRDRFVLEVPRWETSTSIHPDASLDLVAAFGRDAELIVEIGPGAGESLIPMAEVRPEANVLAFEVYRPAIARMLGSLVRAGVENVRIIEADAVAGLERLLPARSIDDALDVLSGSLAEATTPQAAAGDTSVRRSGGVPAETGRNVARGDGLCRLCGLGYATSSRPIRASPTSIRTAKRRAGRPGRSASSSSGRWMRAARSSTLAIAVSTEATGPGIGSVAARHQLRRHELLRMGGPGGPAYGAGRAGDLACPHTAARGAPATGVRGPYRCRGARARPSRSR